MNTNPAEAYIFDAIRTPRGKGRKEGALHEVKPVMLLSGLLTELQKRNDLDTSTVDDIVMGVVSPVGEQGTVISKTAAITANWDCAVAGVQINRFCASGAEAVALAAMKVISGWEDLVVAGGVESMSRVPMGSDIGAWVLDPAIATATGFIPQGIAADLLATYIGLTREDVDNFAFQSQSRAKTAIEGGYFNKSLVPVKDECGLVILDHEEYVRPDTTTKGLANLSPTFVELGKLGFNDIALAGFPQLDHINHVHHAGNSSGIVDGAGALLIGSESIGKKLNLTPRCKIVCSSVTAGDPTLMLLGPELSTRKLLAKTGLSVDDIDLFEVNEAFASVPLRFMAEMKVPKEKVNVNGGAIALGHPLGASGAILIGTLIDELDRRKLKRGIVTICAGAGIGIAMLVERP